MAAMVRPMGEADLALVRDVERRAGEAFRAVGLPDVAESDPPAEAVLRGYAAGGRAWVSLGPEGAPVGYVLADVVDGCAHVEQVSVDPGAQGRGHGRALLDRVVAWARVHGHPAVTLTTFAEVAWNRPLYEHLGFRVIDEDGIGPGLRAVRASEAASGLDPAARVCMRRDLDPP